MTTPVPELTPAWEGWIKENLDRGCDIESMVEAMSAGGFSSIDARACIVSVMNTQDLAHHAAMPACALTQLRGQHVRTLMAMSSPDIALFDQVLTEPECDELVLMSRHKLKRSTTVNTQDGSTEVIQDRSSNGTYFNVRENEFIAGLDERLSDLTGHPVEHGEGLQVLQYHPGGQYKAHFDYFAPEDPGSALHLRQGGQRVCTVVLYLNEVAAGGQTHFPRLNLTILPKKGAALYFSYCDPTGRLDARTLHAGMPVVEGEKWIATKWIRSSAYG
jgi:prolyl 4-hydroxylase